MHQTDNWVCGTKAVVIMYIFGEECKVKKKKKDVVMHIERLKVYWKTEYLLLYEIVQKTIIWRVIDKKKS